MTNIIIDSSKSSSTSLGLKIENLNEINYKKNIQILIKLENTDWNYAEINQNNTNETDVVIFDFLIPFTVYKAYAQIKYDSQNWIELQSVAFQTMPHDVKPFIDDMENYKPKSGNIIIEKNISANKITQFKRKDNI